MTKRRDLPPLNALKMFEAVARNNSFSLAADELCVTHSAVSHQIKLLESWLDKKLLKRHAQGATLTMDGQQLFTVCVQLFNSLENCVEQIKQKNDHSEVILGASNSFMANWLIPRIEKFESLHPNVQIKLQTCNDFKTLEKNQIDMLIMSRLPNDPLPLSIQAIVLFEDKIGPVCTPEKSQHLEKPLDILNQTLLHTYSNQYAWKNWSEHLQIDVNLTKQQRYLDHLSLMLEAAASGLGIAIAPQLLVQKELDHQRLVAPFGFVACGANFSLCLQKERTEDINLQHLSEWLLREADE